MIVSEIIRKKREGLSLDQAEINFIVEGASNSSIPDYQLSAWLMSVFFKSMSPHETYWLTQGMRNSGETYDWKKLNPKLGDFALVDKHSTGGVGDKVTLILVPLAIELGLKVPMISGRGLGHTGGTVDKLLSVPGFKMSFSPEKAAELLENVGACMLSQSEKLCPADKKFYHLRDVTATVESYPLITASIVSKKWAEGCESLVYDVKYGEGAFMATKEHAEELGTWLLAVSKLANLKAEAVLSRMEEPLGTCIGNALEVRESVWILRNEYPSAQHKELALPLKKLCCQLAARMAILGGTRTDFEATSLECNQMLESGRAFAAFDKMLCAQGAKKTWLEELPQTNIHDIKATASGVVSDIKARELGILGLDIGIGRKKMDDKIIEAAGLELLVGIGSKISVGDTLARVHLNETPSEKFIQSILNSFVLRGSTNSNDKGELLWKILQQK